MADETGTRELFAGALQRFGALVHQAPADACTAPTPCSEWDVRRRASLYRRDQLELPPLRGRSVADDGDSPNGDLLRHVPVASWDAAAATRSRR